MIKKYSLYSVCMLLVIIISFIQVSAQNIPTPEQFFGFKLGSDYKLAGWEKISTYFRLLDESSDKVEVVDLGRSTEDNPFIMAIISSPDNLMRLDEFKANSRRIANPKGLSEAEAHRLAKENKIIVLITCSLHASEVGAAQASPELVYNLVTDENSANQEILDNVIFLLVPSFNPDGLEMVKNWYDQYVETPYEGSSMPWLYQKYTGHDNNRDAYMLTQIESQMVTNVMYKEWFPQIYLDMHQMGNSGPRIFVPPYQNPLNPNVDPLITWENSLFGEHMAMDLETQGMSGVGTNMYFTAWWQGAFLMTAWWHNMVGLLTELASCQIATPIFQDQSDLVAGGRGLPEYKIQTNFPNPWPGGWWRLRNIVEYDLVAAYSVLETAAKFKEKFIYNHYLMGKKAIDKGKSEPPYAFVLPPLQHDNSALYKLLEVLNMGGVEIHQSTTNFTADGLDYPAGSYIILMSQAYRAFAKDLLEPQQYPDIRQYPGGPPIAPYDASGWTLSMQMGVNCFQVSRSFEAELKRVTELTIPKGKVSSRGGYAYVLPHTDNNSFIAINRLLSKGASIYRTSETFNSQGRSIPEGSILVRNSGKSVQNQVSSIASDLNLNVQTISSRPKIKAHELAVLRFGIYQPWTRSMHEGWSRWVFEQYEFSYKNIHNDELRTGRLIERYNVIYIPDLFAGGIVEGRPEGTVAPHFAKGIGPQGVTNLREFVEQGGTLITIDSSSELLISEFGLPIRNVLRNIEQDKFFCPGSILGGEYNINHPVAFGMPKLGIIYFSRSSAYKIIPSFTTNVNVIAKYPAKNVLKSGWLLGENYVANRVAAAEIAVGKGHVILFGFDPINRAQAHATFKLLFNAMYFGPSELIDMP